MFAALKKAASTKLGPSCSRRTRHERTAELTIALTGTAYSDVVLILERWVEKDHQTRLHVVVTAVAAMTVTTTYKVAEMIKSALLLRESLKSWMMVIPPTGASRFSGLEIQKQKTIVIVKKKPLFRG